MDFSLDHKSQRLAALASELASEFALGAAANDHDRLIPPENFDRLRETGLFGAAFSEDLGGLGARSTGWLATIEALAKGDSSTALGFNMHYVATRLVSEFPYVPDHTRKHVASLVIDEGALICAPLSEPASSSLLPSTYLPTLTATRVDGGLRVSGNKMFASIWEASDYAFVFARPAWSDDPTHVVGFLLPTNQPDRFEVIDNWHTLGMRATRSNQVKIADAFVPDDLVLCEFDDFLGNWIIGQAHVTWGGYTGCYLGVAEALVEWLQGHLGNRSAKGFAQPMGYHPTISSAVGQIAAHVDAARLMMYFAAWEADENSGPSLRTCHAFLKAKLMVANAIGRITEVGTTAGGLHALMQDHPYERMLRDAATGAIMPPNALACAEMSGLLAMGLDPSQAPTLAMSPA